MSYDKKGFTVGRGSHNNYYSPLGLAIHTYKSLDDPHSEIDNPDYFPDYFGFSQDDFALNDLLFAMDFSGEARLYRINSFNPVVIDEDSAGLNEIDYTHITTWGGAFSTPIAGGNLIMRKITRVSNPDVKSVGSVICTLEDLNGSADVASAITATTPLPLAFRPDATLSIPIIVRTNLTNQMGAIVITTSGDITVWASPNLSSTFPIAANTGFTSKGGLSWATEV